MKRKRENSSNVVHRLLCRETASAPPASTISQSRRFFESIVPNTAIKGIQPPPGHCLSRFTPCGRFLISFDALKNEVVLHSFKGINLDGLPTTTTTTAATAAAEGSAPRQQQQRPAPPAVKFEDAFDLHAQCPVVTGLDEQLFAFSLAVHSDYLVLASSTPDVRPIDGEGGAWLGVSENVTFHLLDMLSGSVLDRLTLRADSIHLTHLGAASLYDDLMTIVAPGQRKIYVIRIEKEKGTMKLIRTLGPRCREDDAYGVMTGLPEVENDPGGAGGRGDDVWRLIGGENGEYSRGSADNLMRPSANEDNNSRAASEAEATRRGMQEEQEPLADDGDVGQAAQDTDGMMMDRRASDESEDVLFLEEFPTPLLIEGLKQRLLSRLYLDAVEKTKKLAADQQKRQDEDQPQQQQQQRQRTVLPIEQFYYFFDVYLEMEMLAVLLIDPSRLLITWMPPLNHRGTSHLPSHIRGLHMLYDMNTTRVERVFEGGSEEFAEWCLVTASAVMGGAPANDWERFLIPGLWGQHLRRRAAQDPFIRATLNHPGCQQQQGSPYLDPELYQFDERAVTRDLVPRPQPHRPAKFVARIEPERLRFKFEPEDVMGDTAAGGRGGGGAGAPPYGTARAGAGGGGDHEHGTEVVFIFHPVAPFVVAVVESTETGLAEELAFFTHDS